MDFAIWQTASVAAGVGLAGTSAYFSPWVWRHQRMRAVRKQLAQSRTLVLTYDDGPSNEMTSQILGLLRNSSAHATFFLLGRRAEQNPAAVDQIVQEGHDVGCHSYNHLNAWKTGVASALADIREGYSRMSRWIPSDGMFRPPHGKMSLPTYWEIRRRRAPVWWWTIDSGDTHERMPSPGSVIDNLRRDGGGIVLMHDLDREKERNDFMLELTATLLHVARKESFRVATLRDLCN